MQSFALGSFRGVGSHFILDGSDTDIVYYMRMQSLWSTSIYGGGPRVTLGDRLKRYRKKAGLTQRKLAAQANVRQAMISDLETNKRLSTQLDIVEKLAAGLGISVGKLVEEACQEDPYTTPHLHLAMESIYR
jgi:DNA-binding XRE family transcriptional regulator